MRGIALLTLAAAATFFVVGVANADRKPTSKERIQIATIVHLPAKCARVRVSTVTKKPKWGSVSFKSSLSDCEPLASNGVTVVTKTAGRWRFVTAGSSFDCPGLYAKVPKAISQDLGIKCT
jgi:hypothetical protein